MPKRNNYPQIKLIQTEDILKLKAQCKEQIYQMYKKKNLQQVWLVIDIDRSEKCGNLSKQYKVFAEKPVKVVL